MTEDHTDAIRSGMEKWEQTRKAALDAIERCRASEDKAARYEAQNEILKSQNEKLTEENIRLRSQVEDAKVGLSAAMAALLAARDNLLIGNARQNGSFRASAASVKAVAEAIGVDDGKPIPGFLKGGPAVKS